MIDLEQLTEQQRWGLQFATLEANEQRGPNTPAIGEAEYAENVFRSACETYYAALLKRKQQIAIERFETLTAQQQTELLMVLQVPDILPAET